MIRGIGSRREVGMARNPVQFQKGLSMAEFLRRYGTEEQCHAALVAMRWPEGFVCPACGAKEHGLSRPRRLFQCKTCRVQTSAKAGTIFHQSKTPLTKWFLAIHLMTSAKNDVAALELARQLGVKWDTAWLIKQKLMEVMRERNEAYRLSGDVQVDDAYLGGEKPGRAGRGAGNKLPFVIAVATRDGKPTYMHLRPVAGFTKEALKAYGERSIAPGSLVVSDGLACFEGLSSAGLMHMPVVTGGGRPADARFKWVNTALGNVKSAITGTCRSCDAHHSARYLAAYEWRFNRRFELAKNVERLARAGLGASPRPYREIAAVRPSAEMSG
jgi:transposase-like protein